MSTIKVNKKLSFFEKLKALMGEYDDHYTGGKDKNTADAYVPTDAAVAGVPGTKGEERGISNSAL